jgi:hypothetical protein
MKLDRNNTRLLKMNQEQDDGFIQATMRQRIEMVWDITVALWSVSSAGEIDAQSRLQRDVASLKRGAV